ncbi:MAG: amino acid adenylation domain-containing protein, partial [Geminicoccaceae bacterium]
MSNQLSNLTNILPYSENNSGSPSEFGSFDLVRSVEQHASTTPDKMAVSFGSTGWTYRDLVAAVDRLAYRLRQEHVGRQSRVALCTPPDQHAPVALLAILKLGAVYVPIGSDYPKARIQAIIDDVKPAMVLTVGGTAALFDDMPVKTGDLATLSAPMDSPPLVAPPAEMRAEDDAYIFYTSGTTGAPKGIAVGYQALSFYIHAGIDAYGITADDAMLSVAKYSFSISLFELLSPLVAGGRLMLLERDQVMVAAELTKALQQATVAHIGPSLLRKTLEHINNTLIEPASFDHMRHISVGGDVAPPELLEGMKETFRNADVCVIYGCTEIACMGCTYFAPRDQAVDKTYVGKPFAGMEVLLLGEDDQPVARGDVGEVLFAGPGLLNGYINKPHLTAKKRFTLGNKTYFRTGDVGRLAPSGDLELLGRRDFQVKVRGLRIEPVEIEVHLRRVPGVREAVVATVDGRDGEKRLAAYLVTGDQAPPTISIIRAHLA